MKTQEQRYKEAEAKFKGDGRNIFPLMEALANEGYVEAQCLLGFCYKNGRMGVSQDIAKATEWFRKAAAQDDTKAKEALNSLADSNSVKEKISPTDDDRFKEAKKFYANRKFDKAFSIFEALAKEGHALAQYQLGVCYQYGNGAPRDGAKSAEWYGKAFVLLQALAKKGDAEAQYQLGVCYSCGDGVSEDRSKAAEWYRKAAEQGHADAQESLARCYEHGHGVTADSAAAREWWRKAAAQGNESAREALDLCPKCGVALKDEGIQGDDRVYKCPKCDYEKYVPMRFGPPPGFD